MNWIAENFPYATRGVLGTIRSYYPNPLFAFGRYFTPFDRIKSLIAGFPIVTAPLILKDALINCNSLYFAHANLNNTYNYRFSIPPGIHGIDLLYTFCPIILTLRGYDLSIPVPLLYAKGWQSYVISFVKYGNPNVERAGGTVLWSLFGNGKNIVDVTPFGIYQTTDNQLPDDRCAFWQPAPYI